MAGSTVLQSRRERAAPPHLGAEGRRGRRVRELAAEEEVPDIFERALLGQLDRRVLPVVEEAFLAAHVADRRLGHHHALEPGRDLPAGLAGGPDAGHRHEVAQRHDAHAAVALHDRQVAVVVRGQAGPGRVGPLVGAEDIGAGGHPEADVLAVGVGLRRRRPAAGRARSGCRRPCRRRSPRPSPCRPPASLGPRAARVSSAGARHCGGGHEIAHNGFHVSHYDALSLRL